MSVLMSDVVDQFSQQPWHLLLHAAPGLTPFESPAAVDAAVSALVEAARQHGAMVLAFAVLPNQLEALLAPDSAGAGPALTKSLRSLLTRRVNLVLHRTGTLCERGGLAEVLAPEVDWLELAEAIEQRVVAGGLADEAGETLSSSAHPDYGEWVRQPLSTQPGSAKRRTTSSDGVTIGDVIGVAPVPLVVQTQVVRQLAAEARASGEPGAELQSYVAGWFLDDPRTLAVARALLGGLARTDHGTASFVTGLYGAGKSHLLAVLGLVAELPALRDLLGSSQPALADLSAPLRATEPRLVVAMALDEESPSQDLEDIVFDAAVRALAEQVGVDAPLVETAAALESIREHLLPRFAEELDEGTGGRWEGLAESDPRAAITVASRLAREQGWPFRLTQSRVERLGRLLEVTAEAGLAGVVLLLDELSVFLRSRERRGLHADAGFLQFLGQRTELSPLWVVAALQRQIEDIGDIEHYTLRQIKDRYETRLSLPLTATRHVLARKVLPRRDPARLEAAVEAALTAWSGGRRCVDLNAAVLRETYPLHPLTCACLEACAERFLAKTRSVIEFAVARVQGDELAPGCLDRPATALLLPDELWDQFARDIVQHPDLRAYREVVGRYYEQNLPALFEQDLALAERLLKLLLVCRLAGVERGVKDLAAALLPWSDNRERRVAAMLEVLRTQGAYVRVERRAGEANDVYTIDLEFDANETIRRRSRSLAATLTIGDSRLTSVAVEACATDAFALASALHPHSTEVRWRNTRRQVFVALRDLVNVSAHELENQAALLAGLEVEEAGYLYLAEPQRPARQQVAFEAALAEVTDERWGDALAAWVPREATPAERRCWVEDVALELLRRDPTLLTGERERTVRARLDEHADERHERLRLLLHKLYLEGRFITRDGVSEVVGETWQGALGTLAGSVLDQVFPDFAGIAPRRTEIPPGTVERLFEGVIQPGEAIVSPTSVLALAVEEVLAPLGLATGEKGSYRLVAVRDGLAQAVLDLLPDRAVSLGAIERFLARSTRGLVAEQSQVVLAALVRLGYLTALDDELRPTSLRLPLRAHVAALAPTTLTLLESWDAFEPWSTVVANESHPPLTAAAQQRLYERLVTWQDVVTAGAAEIREAVAVCGRALGHERVQWRETAETVEAVERLAQSVEPGLQPAEALGAAATLWRRPPPAALVELLRRFRRLRRFAQSQVADLLREHEAMLRVPLPADHELSVRRQDLLGRMALGEAVAEQPEPLLEDLAAWRRAYAEAYSAWHAEAHHADRYAPYDRLRVSPLSRALINLSRLALDVSDDAETLAAELRTERLRQCRRAELSMVLSDEPYCPDCRLGLGETPPLRSVEEFATLAQRGVDGLLNALRAPAARAKIDRGIGDLPAQDARVVSIRRLLGEELSPEALLSATSFAVIDLLNQALNTRVAGRRSVGRLGERLTGRRLTTRQARQAFDQWLDPAGGIGEDDLLEFEE